MYFIIIISLYNFIRFFLFLDLFIYDNRNDQFMIF